MTTITECLNFGTVYFREKAYSPDVIRANIDAVAGNLSKKFISNSPFVYLYAPNHIKMVYALFGILAAGKTCVLVDPKIGRFELEEMLKDSPPGAIIKPEKATDTFDFNSEFEFKHYQLAPSRIAGMDDVAIMLYTAADDGFAKGAMLTHENILANARAIIECNEVVKGTVSCSLIAFHHLFALQTGLLAPCVAGTDLLIEDMTDLKALRKTGNSLARFTVTHIYAVPIVYYFLHKLPQRNQFLATVKSLVSGGAKMPLAISSLYTNDATCQIREGYGLTEASPICTWHRPHDRVKPETVGRTFPCCEIRIFDELNLELPCGQQGEICVKGTNVFKGYFCNPAATDKVFKDRYLRTGDLGSIDVEGYVTLKGLKKRMLNNCGNKVYPAELERHLQKNEHVRYVEAFGEMDELVGDIVKAKVRLRQNTKEDQANLQKWCIQHLTRYKVPQNIEFL